MISTLQSNRVRRTYLGGGRIDAFCGGDRVFRGGSEYPKDSNSLPTPEDWMASTVTAFNGKVEIEGEGLGRLADGRLVKDVVGSLPVLVKLLDSDERLVIQAHPTVPFAKARMNSPVGKTECWYFLPGTAPDACVYLGFKPGITREKWVTAFNETNAVDGVAVVTEGAGDLNGVAVRKGDRLVFADERELKLTGKAEVVVCA